MATANPRSASATPAPLASAPNGIGNNTAHAHEDLPLTNGHGHHHHHHHHRHVPVQDPRPAPTPNPSIMSANSAAAAAAPPKKGKGKKALDSSEASKLVAARISQLEVDTAAEKEQEAEIGTFYCFPLPLLYDVLYDGNPAPPDNSPGSFLYHSCLTLSLPLPV